MAVDNKLSRAKKLNKVGILSNERGSASLHLSSVTTSFNGICI